MPAKQECQNVWSSDKNETGAMSVFCLYVCTCGYIYVPVGAYMNVGECGSQKSASGVVP